MDHKRSAGLTAAVNDRMLVSDFTVCIYTLQLQGLLELEVPLLSQVELSAGGGSRGEKISLRGEGGKANVGV